MFKNHNEMVLYICVLLEKLRKLKNGRLGEKYSKKPEVFSVISRHMEFCKNPETCICQHYDPEYDKKMNSINSRKLTHRASTSFSNEFNVKRKPLKIPY